MYISRHTYITISVRAVTTVGSFLGFPPIEYAAFALGPGESYLLEGLNRIKELRLGFKGRLDNLFHFLSGASSTLAVTVAIVLDPKTSSSTSSCIFFIKEN